MLGRVGKGWFQTPLGLAAAAYLASRGRGSAALTLAAVTVGAYGLAEAFDHVLPHRFPPPGRRSPWTPSYPSGHTLRSTAVITTGAYLASRERLVDWRLALAPAAAVGPLAGLDRVLLDRHWFTDVIGGWLAAVSLAALGAAAYELAREDA